MDPNTPAAPAEEQPIEAEAPAEAPEDTAPSEDSEPAEKPAEEAHKRKNRKSFDRRIAELTARSRQLERELEEARKPVQVAAEPKREDHDDYESYVKAVAAYEAVQAASKHIAEAETRRRQADERREAESYQQSFEEARSTAYERGVDAYPDFEEVTTADDLAISPAMAEAILSSDKAHELWYHLGKHPEIAERIAGLPPVQQGRELGKLEATLGGKRMSAAPKPTQSVQARGSTQNGLTDSLTTEEWIKRRRAQLGR